MVNINNNTINLVATANAVEKNSVVGPTRIQYSNKLAESIVWFYHNGYQKNWRFYDIGCVFNLQLF